MKNPHKIFSFHASSESAPVLGQTRSDVKLLLLFKKNNNKKTAARLSLELDHVVNEGTAFSVHHSLLKIFPVPATGIFIHGMLIWMQLDFFLQQIAGMRDNFCRISTRSKGFRMWGMRLKMGHLDGALGCARR